MSDDDDDDDGSSKSGDSDVGGDLGGGNADMNKDIPPKDQSGGDEEGASPFHVSEAPSSKYASEDTVWSLHILYFRTICPI